MQVRAAASMDVLAVQALLAAQVGDRRIADPFLALAQASIEQPDGERACLVACEGTAVVGAAVYGLVAGADGAGRLHALVGSTEAAIPLLRNVKQVLGSQHGRLVIAELPEVPGLSKVMTILRAESFVDCGRVAGYYGEGTDLIVLRADLGT